MAENLPTPMRELLVINPNTSAAVSALLQQHVQGAVGPQLAVRTVTARFGARYIACEASYAVAAHAALDAWALALAQGAQPQAVLIGCFGDPGLLALRQACPAPVSGLAEAACNAAARHGRYAIVTGGARWAPILRRLVHTLGQADALAAIHTVAPSGAQLAADPAGAHALLAAACRAAAREPGVQALILGGAGLAGMAAALQPELDIALIDSVQAGAHWARNAQPTPGRSAAGFDLAWTGLTAEMTALGTAPGQ